MTAKYPKFRPGYANLMKRFWFLVLSGVWLLSACRASPPAASSAAGAQSLTVFAAASLTDAFTDIGKDFESANPGVKVSINFAGSQTLRTQIEQGAQVDVFASANTKEMDALVQGKLVAAAEVHMFLTNQLVIITPVGNPAGLKEPADLAKKGMKIDMAAKEVPVGNYTLQALGKLDQAFGNGFQDQVLANVVSYENDVKQVVTKIRLGEADAGIVYTSDAVAAPELVQIAIPLEYNVVANYPLAALNQAKNPALARAFVAYVLSADGQAVLKKWGFSPFQ
jgi:molybdate transport system substrate-binding protein